MDSVLDGIKEIQSILDDAKESIEGGLHLRLCNATLAAYERAEAVKAAEEGQSDTEDEEVRPYLLAHQQPQITDFFPQELVYESESDEEPRERTEDDMDLNELSDLWEGNFDFGRPRAVLPLEGLIEIITMDDEKKRVCAAVRVLNRALHCSKPDDPEDAERILQWKEQLVEEGAIKECGEILEGDREFSVQDGNHWMYSSILESEILELFTRLGEGDALFRTKLRRHGALKGVEAHVKRQPQGAGLPVMRMLRHR